MDPVFATGVAKARASQKKRIQALLAAQKKKMKKKDKKKKNRRHKRKKYFAVKNISQHAARLKDTTFAAQATPTQRDEVRSTASGPKIQMRPIEQEFQSHDPHVRASALSSDDLAEVLARAAQLLGTPGTPPHTHARQLPPPPPSDGMRRNVATAVPRAEPPGASAQRTPRIERHMPSGILRGSARAVLEHR